MQLWNRDLYNKASRLAAEAHSKQLVKGSSANYLLHLSQVVMEVIAAYCSEQNFDINLAITTAWLHDTLEDTTVQPVDIDNEFGEIVLVCVKALTKNKEVAYVKRMPDALERIAKAPVEAAIVKLADRITNLQKPPSTWTREKCISYREEAKVILDVLGSANAVLAERLRGKIEVYLTL